MERRQERVLPGDRKMERISDIYYTPSSKVSGFYVLVD
jgi:hypothetical protein